MRRRFPAFECVAGVRRDPGFLDPDQHLPSTAVSRLLHSPGWHEPIVLLGQDDHEFRRQVRPAWRAGHEACVPPQDALGEGPRIEGPLQQALDLTGLDGGLTFRDQTQIAQHRGCGDHALRWDIVQPLEVRIARDFLGHQPRSGQR
ncbi:MAG TPA: hypothetical protein VGH03_04560 [Caulobacteraceae bacterium]